MASSISTTTFSAAQGRWVLAATILASSMAFIDGSALNTALPAIQADLSASGAELLWIVNAYLLMLAALVLIGGSLGDHLGRKRVFTAGISIFLLGSLACGLAPGTGWLIGFRMLQGIGGALMIPGSLAIINAYFPPIQRGQAIGTWSGVTTIVTVAGPVLGGALADAGLWRGVFLINLPIGLAALWVLFTHVPESRDDTLSGAVDYPGALLAATALAGITYGLLAGPDRGFNDPLIFGALLLGLAAAVLFIVVEARRSEPMLPLHLFRSPTFSGANLLTLFLYGALSVVGLFFSLNLVQVQGYSQTLAGFAFMPFVIILALLSRWAGGLVDRIGPRLPLILGPLTAGIGFLLLALVGQTQGPADYWTTFFPGVAVFGLGMGITVAPLTTTVMGAVPTHYSGTASGINNAVSRTAGVLAIAVLGALALTAFRGTLTSTAAQFDLTAAQRLALVDQASQLGDAAVPAQIHGEAANQVRQAIEGAFVDTYQLVLWICAGMAALSSLSAALLIRGRLDNGERAEGAQPAD
jgi:EmrB/QacA subfamily drug resistance transporter